MVSGKKIYLRVMLDAKKNRCQLFYSFDNRNLDVYKRQSITKGFGKPEGMEDYCRKAQLVNIESNKAMYEGWLDRMRCV